MSLRTLYQRISRKIKPKRKIDIVSRKEYEDVHTKVRKLEFKNYELTPVSSTFITEIGYQISNKQLSIGMGVRGYNYFGVPFNVFEEFYFAHSKGTYYNRYIKGQYNQVRFR